MARLGLPLDEVNAVMVAMGLTTGTPGIPPAVTSPPPKPDAVTPMVGPVKPAQPPVGVRESAPPLVTTPPPGVPKPGTTQPATPPPGKAKPGILGPLLAGAGAGLLVGGPVGAVIGAGAGLLLAPKK